MLSNSASVKQPGILEKISIARSQREFEYSCSTNIYQACKSFQLLTFAAPHEQVFTKVVEVAPLYVISNLTKSRLRVVQSYINSITEANDAILLVPDDRASFSWSNS